MDKRSTPIYKAFPKLFRGCPKANSKGFYISGKYNVRDTLVYAFNIPAYISYNSYILYSEYRQFAFCPVKTRTVSCCYWSRSNLSPAQTTRRVLSRQCPKQIHNYGSFGLRLDETRCVVWARDKLRFDQLNQTLLWSLAAEQ